MSRASALALAAALALGCAGAGAAGSFSFGVIGHSFQNGADEALLQRAIAETDQANLAFVVASGIKAGMESCSDKLYARRKSVLDESRRPLVVSLAASDWSECKNSLGRSVAIERLGRLREVFFGDAASLGERRIELSRLSANPTFRSYAENAHWESGHILFATINLPANNNHFRPEAGRNSEFEDRLVANRAWLKRLFGLAQRRKLDGLVLFSDGDAGVLKEATGAAPKNDGFAEVRRQIRTLAQKFPGQVLLVDTQYGPANGPASGTASGPANGPAKPAITWRANLGHVSVTSNWVEIGVDARMAPLFTLRADAGAAQ